MNTGYIKPIVTDAVICTRHAGTVEWLRRRGIVGTLVRHATVADVKGKTVYGVLPVYLAALAEKYWSVDIPASFAERTGSELAAEDLERIGARLICYEVRRVRDPLAGTAPSLIELRGPVPAPAPGERTHFMRAWRA